MNWLSLRWRDTSRRVGRVNSRNFKMAANHNLLCRALIEFVPISSNNMPEIEACIQLQLSYISISHRTKVANNFGNWILNISCPRTDNVGSFALVYRHSFVPWNSCYVLFYSNLSYNNTKFLPGTLMMLMIERVASQI